MRRIVATRRILVLVVPLLLALGALAFKNAPSEEVFTADAEGATLCGQTRVNYADPEKTEPIGGFTRTGSECGCEVVEEWGDYLGPYYTTEPYPCF